MKNNGCTNRITIQSTTASVPLLEKFAIEILKAKNLLTDPGLTVYQLVDGTILEIRKKGTFHSQDIFVNGNTVLSFQVPDINESVAQMLAAGAQTVDGIVRLSDTYSYCHFLLGADQVVGIHRSG